MTSPAAPLAWGEAPALAGADAGGESAGLLAGDACGLPAADAAGLPDDEGDPAGAVDGTGAKVHWVPPLPPPQAATRRPIAPTASAIRTGWLVMFMAAFWPMTLEMR